MNILYTSFRDVKYILCPFFFGGFLPSRTIFRESNYAIEDKKAATFDTQKSKVRKATSATITTVGIICTMWNMFGIQLETTSLKDVLNEISL